MTLEKAVEILQSGKYGKKTIPFMEARELIVRQETANRRKLEQEFIKKNGYSHVMPDFTCGGICCSCRADIFQEKAHLIATGDCCFSGCPFCGRIFAD